MAEHERYKSLHLAECQCFRPGFRFRLCADPPHVVSHEAAQVTYECPECGDVVGVFYRVPELERESKADKALVGKVVKADRFVAWVGYARNPSTVMISEDALEQRIRVDIAGLVNQALVANTTGGIPESVFTLEQAGWFLQGVNWRVRRGFEQWARYRLWGAAYRTRPLRDRGLWFQDVPIEGTVKAIVVCVTGRQVPGCGGGRWDECEPPYLDGAVHHSLYGIVTVDGWRKLVHSLDVKEVQIGAFNGSGK